jgi:hypothetical protein
MTAKHNDGHLGGRGLCIATKAKECSVPKAFCAVRSVYFIP